MNNRLKSLILALGIMSVSNSWAAGDPLVGTWKTIDDRTGYSLADVVIKKDRSNNYTASITQIRAIPGAPLTETCNKCTGDAKNKPLVGLAMLEGLKAKAGSQSEYVNGTLIDPQTGREYQARARLQSNGKHLIIHSRETGASVGRNMTWVKN